MCVTSIEIVDISYLLFIFSTFIHYNKYYHYYIIMTIIINIEDRYKLYREQL